MLAPLEIFGRQFQAVVDTGAEVTIISERIYHDVPTELRPALQQSPIALEIAEAGRKMNVSGVVNVRLRIADYDFDWPVYIAPIRDDVLLGCDFIHANDIVIRTRYGIQVEGEWIPCELVEGNTRVTRVQLNENVVIPARSEFTLPCKINGRGRADTSFCVVEPVEFSENVPDMCARSLVDQSNDIIPVRVVNSSNSPVKLQKNTYVGEIHPVDTVREIAASVLDEIDAVTQMSSVCRVHKKDGATNKINTCDDKD